MLKRRGSRTTCILPQSGLHVQLSNEHPNMISYLKMNKFAFQKSSSFEVNHNQPIIPLLLNSLHSGPVKLGPRMTRSLEKGGPKTTCIHSQLGPFVQLTNGYPNMISYLQMKNCSFQKSPSFRVNQNQP